VSKLISDKYPECFRWADCDRRTWFGELSAGSYCR